MNTVKCSNRLCEKEYNVQFDNCPFCGTANPMEEGERRVLIEKENNDTELKPEVTNGEKFSGWVTGIIWLNILFGGIRGIINSVTVMMYSPVWGAVDLGLQIIGIISLGFLLLAKKWALYLWVGYLITVSIINGYLNNNDYSTFAIVAAGKLVLMLLFLQIRKDGISAWSIIFNKKKVDATDNDANDPQVVEELIEKESMAVKNGNNSDTIKPETEEEPAVETLDNKDVVPTVDSCLSANKGTAQIEGTASDLQKETTSEELDSIQAEAKNGRNKNNHTGIKIGKWWIYPLIIIATLAIVWLVVWISHRPKEPEFGKYVYVDEYSILHINHNCDKIAVFHGAQPVSIFLINELTQEEWKQVCSNCVSDNDYENLSELLISNENKHWLYKTLVKEGCDMGDFSEFIRGIESSEDQKWCYEKMISLGYVLPSYEKYSIQMGFTSDHPTFNKVTYEKNNKRLLYDDLIDEYDLGSFEQFSSDVENLEKRRKLYNELKHKYQIPNFDFFTRYLLENEK